MVLISVGSRPDSGGPITLRSFLLRIRPLHIKLHFLHLYTLEICLEMHFSVLKTLGLAIPIHASTFPQDFPQLIFSIGGLCPPGLPLKSPMLLIIIKLYVFRYQILKFPV